MQKRLYHQYSKHIELHRMGNCENSWKLWKCGNKTPFDSLTRWTYKRGSGKLQHAKAHKNFHGISMKIRAKKGYWERTLFCDILWYFVLLCAFQCFCCYFFHVIFMWFSIFYASRCCMTVWWLWRRSSSRVYSRVVLGVGHPLLFICWYLSVYM